MDKGVFSHVILNHKDRLLRFSFEVIFSLCRSKGIEVLILEEKENQSSEMEFGSIRAGLISISKLYGGHFHQNRKRFIA